MSTIICLMGPTATGKSDLALKLAPYLPLEIISVDSTNVYRGMDIGSAKPDKKTLQKIPHHLIDIRNPDDTYSAGQFCEDTLKAIQIIEKKQHIPLLVGGTMLYFHALQKGLSALPTADEKIRAHINEEAKKQGWNFLHAKLTNIDPDTAQRLHVNDTQRIQRALEIYEITGIPPSQLHHQQKNYLEDTHVINIGLMPSDREKLRKNISKRFYTMLEMGLLQEVEKLLTYKNKPALRAVGYRQICDYLEGKINKETMSEKAITATCQLAKRQMTWLRSFPNVTFFDNFDPTLFEKVLLFLNNLLAAPDTGAKLPKLPIPPRS